MTRKKHEGKRNDGGGGRLRRDFRMVGIAILAAFGLWHLGDVRSGALVSGDMWLVNGYLVLLAAGLAAAGILGLLLSGRGRTGEERAGRNMERIYFVAGLSLGLLYLFVLPPLSAPDEISHYISAYQLSSHMLGRPSNSEDGHVLVRMEDWFLEDVYGDYTYHAEEGIWVKDGTTDGTGLATVLGQSLEEETYRLIYENGFNRNRADPSGELAQSPYPPVITTPLAYIPQAAGIALARILKTGSLGLAYLGRLGNLLFFVGVTGLAMKRMPFGKEVLFAVALLPMTLHLSASFSYDAWIMAWIFYFTACCLDLAYQAERVRTEDIVTLAAVMAMAGPCKMIYAVFMGLCLLIPLYKFGSRKRWILSAGCVLSVWAVAMLLVNRGTVTSYVTETESYVEWAGEAGYTLGTLIHQPIKCLRLLFNTLVWQAEHYHLTMIGAYLGNIDPILNITYPVVMLFTACLALITFRKPGEDLILTGGRRLWIWLLCLGCAGAAMFSMLLAWTPLSAQVISGVQGRYFLPFLPVLLMTFKNDCLVLTGDKTKELLYVMCCANVYVLLRIFSIVAMRL